MEPPVTSVAWTLVVPLKPLARAKSRLAASTGAAAPPRYALAFAQDTVRAARACPAVRGVAVVTDDPRAARALTRLGARTIPDTPGDGLNSALSHGVESVRASNPREPVAALNADLPALRPAELARVLEAAAGRERAFLADAAGTGTTLLTALPGTALAPLFGEGSRRRHLASGAEEITLPDVPSVRQDVDTGEDLRAALTLGVGPFTSDVRPFAAGSRARTPGRAAR